MRRTWIKLFCDQWLRGSIRQENFGVRAVFADLITMAGDSAWGEDGIIQIAENVGFTDELFSNVLNIPLDVWLSAKERLSNHPDKNENRIEITSLLMGFSIKILNWKKYQSEYERQKPHREPKFIKLRESIKKRDNFTCQNCNKNEEELLVPLCIHHIDNDPVNNIEENLITLCMTCHAHILKRTTRKTKEKKIQEKMCERIVQQKGSKEKCNNKVQKSSSTKKEIRRR